MQVLKFNIGDDAWLHLGGKDNPLVKSKVVHIFEYHGTQYVCEVPTHIDPVLEVREGWSLSDDPSKPIGFLRR